MTPKLAAWWSTCMGLIAANYLWQWAFARNWPEAFSRSWWQIVAVSACILVLHSIERSRK